VCVCVGGGVFFGVYVLGLVSVVISEHVVKLLFRWLCVCGLPLNPSAKWRVELNL